MVLRESRYGVQKSGTTSVKEVFLGLTGEREAMLRNRLVQRQREKKKVTRKWAVRREDEGVR